MPALLLAGTAAWLVYAALGNTLLPLRLRSVAETAGLSLEFESAYSMFPGQLRLRELELSDAHAGWRVEARRVRCDFDMLGLLLGSPRIRALQAQGVVVEIDPTIPSTPEQAAFPTPAAGAEFVRAGLAQKQSSAGSTTQAIIVDDARASGTRLSFGAHTLEGEIDYRISNASLSEAGADADFALELDDVELIHAGRRNATLQGRIQASVEANPGKPGLWQRMAGNADLSGALLSLEPWLGSAPEAVELIEARHRLKFAFRAGQVQSGNFALEAREVSLRHADTSRTKLTQAPELTVRLDPGDALAVHGVLRAGKLALQDPTGATWAELSGFRLDTRLPKPAGEKGHAPGKLKISADANISALGASISGPLAGRAKVEHIALADGRVELGAGKLDAPGVRLNADTSPDTAHHIQTRLDVASASLDLSRGLDFRGDFRVRGDDASLLVDLVSADETVRWTLSLLKGRPFELRSSIANQGETFALRELTLQAAGLSAEGSAYTMDGATRGAFLVRGPFAIGVSLASGAISTEAPVNDDWLEARLQRMSHDATVSMASQSEKPASAESAQ